jgi:RND superfamily putative drug exporter
VPAASTPADAAWAKPNRRSAALWWATVVTKAPMLWVVLVVVGLGLLALPAANLNLALPNSGQSQPGELDRVTFDLVSQRFGVGYNGPLVLTVDIVESDDPLGVVNGLRDEIEALPGVELVSMATPNANVDTGLIQIIPTTAADDPQTTALVQTLRGKYDEWLQRYGCPTAVTGYTAIMIDVTDRLRDSMLPFGGFVVGLSFLLLMVVFRSIWVPVKAALGYLLSVGGAFGATQLVFNEGVGKWIINLQEPGPVISFLPIFGMGILFGLAMDYEVFLTSRMREEYVHGNTDDFVRAGFASASKVVVAAAFIMFGVFAFFVPATVGMVKPIAFCLAVGIGLDAFLIRMTLGPAVMALLGKRAWWLPAWLDRILPVLDVEGETLAHQMRVREALGGGGEVIIARGLGATVGERTYFEDVDVDVLPGEILCVQGAPAARRALLYGLAGRVRLSSGDAMVAGRVIGAESALVRREAMLLKPGDGFNKALRSSKAKVVLVDGLEELSAKQALTLGAAIAARQATFVLGVGPNTDVDSVVDAPHKVVRLGGAS